jgi:hypothetical protein
MYCPTHSGGDRGPNKTRPHAIYCLFDGTFCEQTDGVAMGSLLAPIAANIYMEKFKQKR